ncbi:cytochrome P450 [Hyaloscypha variabilis]
MLTAIVYATIALITVCYLSDWLFCLWDSPRTPPRARSRVPLVGHLIGLMRARTSYYTEVSAQQHSDVYTIGIFNFKIYVINSRRLIPLVQRLSKTLSFTPFQQFATRVYIDCSSHTVDLHGNPDFTRDLDKVTRAALTPGPHLDYQNSRTVKSLNESLDELLLGSSPNDPVRIRLYQWSRDAVTLAATNGVFGSSNPFLDKKIEGAFWTWNEGLPTMVVGLGLFAREALRARQLLVNSFKTYLNNDYQDAAEVIKERIRILSKYGVPLDDIARMQATFNIALLSNTAPSAFWTLFNVFSRPELLQELRAELEECAVSQNSDNSGYELDIVAVKMKCPRLLSVFEETQRTLTIHANIRKVLEDTTLGNYHLQKGSYVQIPNAPIHNDGELWGPNPTEFNPRRFTKNDGTALSSSLPSNSFLAWGVAPHLCPARQFASTEVLAMAALLFLRVEMEPVGGIWKRPEPKVGDLVTVLPPKTDVEVEVRQRVGWDGNWVLKIGKSTSKVPLTSG